MSKLIETKGFWFWLLCFLLPPLIVWKKQRMVWFLLSVGFCLTGSGWMVAILIAVFAHPKWELEGRRGVITS